MGDSMRRGSVVLAIYPFTDLSSAKRRPALVVSATGRPGRDCILAFITSRTGKIEATDLVLDLSDECPTHDATSELLALMQVYNQLWICQSEALAEAVRRGLQRPLES